LKEFMFVFRRDPASVAEDQRSPERMQNGWKAWQDWLNGLERQNKLAATGKRLSLEGNVVQGNNIVTNGPYVELKESVVGYMFVKAHSLEDATELTKGCPNLATGGTVEVRPVFSGEGKI
jgi:hypothetical protein